MFAKKGNIQFDSAKKRLNNDKIMTRSIKVIEKCTSNSMFLEEVY